MTERGTTPERADAVAAPSSPGVTVYFDGACPLCSFEIAHYARQTGAEGLAFVDVGDVQVPIGADLTRSAALQRFHVRARDGRLLSGAEAFVAIWDVLPGWRWAAGIARLPGVLRALEAGYRAFLPIRPWLSRLAGRMGARASRDGQGKRYNA